MISASGCGVIATVIPVLLLAGLLGPSTTRMNREYRTRATPFPILASVVSMLGATVVCCVGAAQDGLSTTASVGVWFGLGWACLYVLGEVYLSLTSDT